jgi:hypothetical protein
MPPDSPSGLAGQRARSRRWPNTASEAMPTAVEATNTANAPEDVTRTATRARPAQWSRSGASRHPVGVMVREGSLE